MPRTLEEELAEKGIVAKYIWKPNRLYVRDGSEYRPVDVVSDGDAATVSQEIQAMGLAKKNEIEALAQQQLDALDENQEIFENVRENLIETYTRMQNYFDRHGLVSLSTVMATAIVNLNSI